jgi:hypothetical protein
LPLLTCFPSFEYIHNVSNLPIAAKLDAEEWRDLVGAYIDAASAAVVEMGGHLNTGP